MALAPPVRLLRGIDKPGTETSVDGESFVVPREVKLVAKLSDAAGLVLPLRLTCRLDELRVMLEGKPSALKVPAEAWIP